MRDQDAVGCRQSSLIVWVSVTHGFHLWLSWLSFIICCRPGLTCLFEPLLKNVPLETEFGSFISAFRSVHPEYLYLKK